MVSTWMGDHSGVEVDAVVKNTVKSQEWINGASKKLLRQKKKKKKNLKRPALQIDPIIHITATLWPFNIKNYDKWDTKLTQSRQHYIICHLGCVISGISCHSGWIFLFVGGQAAEEAGAGRPGGEGDQAAEGGQPGAPRQGTSHSPGL